MNQPGQAHFNEAHELHSQLTDILIASGIETNDGHHYESTFVNGHNFRLTSYWDFLHVSKTNALAPEPFMVRDSILYLEDTTDSENYDSKLFIYRPKAVNPQAIGGQILSGLVESTPVNEYTVALVDQASRQAEHLYRPFKHPIVKLLLEN